jgi:hypothetical protein
VFAVLLIRRFREFQIFAARVAAVNARVWNIAPELRRAFALDA